MFVVVFDCESDGRPIRHAGEEADFSLVQCTVACAIKIPVEHLSNPNELDLSTCENIICWRDVIDQVGANPFQRLFDAFDEAILIVGFNSEDFDLPLLRKYYPKKSSKKYFDHKLKSLDIFSRVRNATGKWPKLSALLELNGLGGKSGDGGNAVVLWNEQRRDELREYCMVDVIRTAQLGFLHHLKMPGGDIVPRHVYGIIPALAAMKASTMP